MKKFFFSMMAMLAFAGSAIAQGPKFIVDDVMMDENGKGTITVKFEFDKDDYYGNFQMDILLPDEFTPVTGRNGIKPDPASMVEGGFALASSVLTVAEEKDINYGKKVLRLIGSCNDGYAIIGQQGVLLTVPVTCATTVDGAFDVKLNNILINVATLFSDDTDNPDRGQEIRPEEVNFKIVAGETVGIREVQGTSQDGTVYNLNGQRVQKAQKGLFIENGKKVVKK
jgi:hypothetical protein